jgi:hypothetical protein
MADHQCQCPSCKNLDRIIEHKKTFTPTQLGLKGGRRAKRAYLARLEASRRISCSQSAQND